MNTTLTIVLCIVFGIPMAIATDLAIKFWIFCVSENAKKEAQEIIETYEKRKREREKIAE